MIHALRSETSELFKSSKLSQVAGQETLREIQSAILGSEAMVLCRLWGPAGEGIGSSRFITWK